MFIVVGDIRRSHLLLTAESGEKKKGPSRESIGLRRRMTGREGGGYGGGGGGFGDREKARNGAKKKRKLHKRGT